MLFYVQGGIVPILFQKKSRFNCIYTLITLLHLALIYFTGVRRSIKDFRPRLDFRKPKTRSLVKSLPNAMYTSPECLKVIKNRDKDANAHYVQEYITEVSDMLGPSCKRKL